ncbi:unnamed protein product [Dovyalis caffra]|uniref:Uncharacterized protein n=1 Tax=Dovyalis caffra TaxID=77055 RepID=A0AAV1SD67_9ROSI|nr:unnamed protein product [Dovyalis caffra]
MVDWGARVSMIGEVDYRYYGLTIDGIVERTLLQIYWIARVWCGGRKEVRQLEFVLWRESGLDANTNNSMKLLWQDTSNLKKLLLCLRGNVNVSEGMLGSGYS